jgi:glycosyltransferase involved in cell wall biosynthesis
MIEKKRLAFINGGKHFWNREKEFFSRFTNFYEVLLVINHRDIETNYNINDIEGYCCKHGIKLLKIDYSNTRARNPLFLFKNYKDVSLIKNFKPDIIYIESFGSPYFALWASLLFNKKKVIFAILDYKLHQYTQTKSRKLNEKIYQKIYLKSFTNFQLFSSDQANMMRRDYPNKKIFYIKLFLIENDFSVIEKEKIEKKKNINFLFFGKIHYYKGLDILIKAGNILSKNNPNFKIIIAGKAKNPKQYIDLIENNKNFELKLEYLDKDVIPNLFNNTDYIVLPYREVSQSGPLSIAFAFRVVPIVSDLIGFKELISDNKNGFVFKSESPEKLAEKMEMVMNFSLEKRQVIKDNLKDFINKEYSIDKFVKDYKLMFDSVIKSSLDT